MTATLVIPLVPAGRIRLLRRPEDMRQGFPDESWPLVLEFELLAGETKRVELP